MPLPTTSIKCQHYYIYCYNVQYIIIYTYLHALNFRFFREEVEWEAVRHPTIWWQSGPETIHRDHLVTVVWSQYTGHLPDGPLILVFLWKMSDS